MQRRIVVGECQDWTRRCLPRLEADCHPTEPGPPDPATTLLIMLDIHPGRPILTPGLRFSRRVVLDRIFGPVRNCCPICEEILLQHIGQPSYSHTEEPDPAGGVDSIEERSGDRADHLCAVCRAVQRA